MTELAHLGLSSFWGSLYDCVSSFDSVDFMVYNLNYCFFCFVFVFLLSLFLGKLLNCDCFLCFDLKLRVN